MHRCFDDRLYLGRCPAIDRNATKATGSSRRRKRRSDCNICAGRRPTDAPLALTTTISLPDVKGRVDHLSIDAKRRLLYVAALGNGSLEVVSLDKHERIRSIGGLAEPQGVAYLADVDRVAVACGGDGSVRFFDGRTTEPTGTIDLGDDADNVHYDAVGKRLWVGFGDLSDAGPKLRTKISTDRGARTAFLDETSGVLYVAVPRRGEMDAESRIYDPR